MLKPADQQREIIRQRAGTAVAFALAKSGLALIMTRPVTLLAQSSLTSLRTSSRFYGAVCALILFSSCLAESIALADMQKDWFRLRTTCLKQWSASNYIHPVIANRKWLVAGNTANMIAADPGADWCMVTTMKLGIEESRTCYDETLLAQGVITERELRSVSSLSYICTTLIKIEGSDLVEYQRSSRFGLVRRVVGMTTAPGEFWDLPHRQW